MSNEKGKDNNLINLEKGTQNTPKSPEQKKGNFSIPRNPVKRPEFIAVNGSICHLPVDKPKPSTSASKPKK